MMKKLYYILCLFLGVTFANAEDAASPFSKLFGDALLDAQGDPLDLSALEGKHVGIYFTAGWCGPCRRFSPSLVAFRDKFQQDFEVVIVGSDNSQESHDAYRKKAKMKWPQVKWGSEQASMLSQGFKVTGIPMLVLVNPKGEVLTQKGRELITAHADLVKAESDRLVFEEELYMCGQCDKQHRRLKLSPRDS